MLLIDCPLLLLEAVALDRSAAVFIPLHVVVAGDQRSGCVHWAHPADSMGLRAPRVVKQLIPYTRASPLP
jgi:hypothetical protein